MQILFVHQNFPAQFKNLAPALARSGHEVIGLQSGTDKKRQWAGIDIYSYSVTKSSTPGIHPWLTDFETKIIRAESSFNACISLKNSGINPDVIVAHHAWGDSLFLKEVWPKAKLGIYCEFFYSSIGADVGFDPEFPPSDPYDPCRIRLKNLTNFLHFDLAETGISPTQWQASTFPLPFREKISVIHEGIDTDILHPNVLAQIKLPNGVVLTKDDPVITFVNRNLEPYRGYHSFIRSLPEVMRRTKAHVFIVGGDGNGYGPPPIQGSTWKRIFLDEIAGSLKSEELSRIYFLDWIDYKDYVSLIQCSSVHVYLTYPFVLSWSVLEAMSVGCAVIGSKTPPVEEVINHGENGLLVDFFNYSEIAESICLVLEDSKLRERLEVAARQTIVDEFDLRKTCLPAQIKWIEQLSARC
jgi:glycosyltransferase involved in cell wall biosynthesis